MNVIETELLEHPCKENFAKIDSTQFLYDKCYFSDESNSFKSHKITSTIISKQKIDNDYLVILSETSSDIMKDCRSCSGELIAILFSKNEFGWYKKMFDQKFSAGGTWGDNAKLELVHNKKNKNPIYIFRNTRTWAGGYGTGEIIVFSYVNNKIIKILDSEERNLMLNHSNSDCCLSLYSEIMIELKDISYEQAFKIAQQKFGKGYRFMWNDSVFTTYDIVEDLGEWKEYCDPGEDGDYSTKDDNGSYYTSACFETKSNYSFVYNKDSSLDDFVINISGTKQKSVIYNNDEFHETFPIKETHYFTFNSAQNLYEQIADNSENTFFNGKEWQEATN
jgi:hypothetical protein